MPNDCYLLQKENKNHNNKTKTKHTPFQVGLPLWFCEFSQRGNYSFYGPVIEGYLGFVSVPWHGPFSFLKKTDLSIDDSKCISKTFRKRLWSNCVLWYHILINISKKMAALVNNSLKKMVGEIRNNYSLDTNVMVYFKPGEYMRKMFIQSVTQATRKKNPSSPNRIRTYDLLVTWVQMRTFFPSRLCHWLNKRLSHIFIRL